MSYIRKTKDVYYIQCDYGYGDGFETVTIEETLSEAKKRKKEYLENDSFARRVKIVCKRERLGEE